MPMNIGFQIHVMRKVILKNCRDNNLPQGMIDDILDSWWENYMDDTLEFSENKNILIENDILTDPNPPYITEEKYYDEIKDSFIGAITQPYYHCMMNGCDYETMFREDMVKHFQEMHELEDEDIPPRNPHDMRYIILDKLTQIAISRTYRNKRNFTVSNKDLHKELLSQLGYTDTDESAPSNQIPRRILNDLGLLGNNELDMRHRIGFDKNSRRVYHIIRKELEDAIYDSEFHDLKIKIVT